MMAYYAWKRVRDEIPQKFVDEWCHKRGLDTYELYDGESYNWIYWEMVSEYIQRLKTLTGE